SPLATWPPAGRSRPYEGFVRQVELSHFHRVAATGRQRYQAEPELRLHALRAFEHPLLVLDLVQRVHVQQGFPLRAGLAVFVQRGAPPDAARMRLVLPEVVEITAH